MWCDVMQDQMRQDSMRGGQTECEESKQRTEWGEQTEWEEKMRSADRMWGNQTAWKESRQSERREREESRQSERRERENERRADRKNTHERMWGDQTEWEEWEERTADRMRGDQTLCLTLATRLSAEDRRWWAWSRWYCDGWSGMTRGPRSWFWRYCDWTWSGMTRGPRSRLRWRWADRSGMADESLWRWCIRGSSPPGIKVINKSATVVLFALQNH